MISFFFSWTVDQSSVSNLFDDSTVIENIGKKFGLIISYHLVYKGFGLGALFIPILICIFSVTKYHLRFNEERKFNELENINISKAVDANILDKKLEGLQWITYINPEEPKKEISWLLESMSIFKEDQSSKILITEYQVVAPILNINMMQSI